MESIETKENILAALNKQSIIDNGNSSIFQPQYFPGEPKYIGGLTKREYIAIQIMSNIYSDNDPEDSAKKSIIGADVLLNELNKR
jgi:hypothetical protein